MSSSISSFRALFSPAVNWAQNAADTVRTGVKDIHHATASLAGRIDIRNIPVPPALKKFVNAMFGSSDTTGAARKHNAVPQFRQVPATKIGPMWIDQRGKSSANAIVPPTQQPAYVTLQAWQNQRGQVPYATALRNKAMPVPVTATDKTLDAYLATVAHRKPLPLIPDRATVRSPSTAHPDRVIQPQDGPSQRDHVKQATRAAQETRRAEAKRVLSPLSGDMRVAVSNDKALATILKGAAQGHRPPGVVTAKEMAQIQDHIGANYQHALDAIFGRTDRQLAMGGQDTQPLQDKRAQLDHRKDSAVRTVCSKQGWDIQDAGRGGVHWEGSAPLLVRKDLSFQGLRASGPILGDGGFGEVRMFKTDDGHKLVGKVMKDHRQPDRGKKIDYMAMELDGYRHVYDTVGPHKNLVNVYGITETIVDGARKRTLLMDAVPGGMTGLAFFARLQDCVKSGKISAEEYSSAVSYVVERLLDVVGHLQKAGIVHNDIKPDNFMIDADTGEPVLLDLGLWTPMNTYAKTGTPDYMDPALESKGGLLDQYTDAFTTGSTVLDVMESYTRILRDPERGFLKPNQGLTLDRDKVRKDDAGNAIRIPGVVGMASAYTDFVNAMMAEKSRRFTIEKARELDFVWDSPNYPVRSPQERKASPQPRDTESGTARHASPDAAARDVLRKVVTITQQELKKPRAEQWKTPAAPETPVTDAETVVNVNADMEKFFERSRNKLADYANLYRRTDRLAAQRAMLVTKAPHPEIVKEMKWYLNQAVTSTTWIDKVMKKVGQLAATPEKSGVGLDGEPRKEGPVQRAEKKRIARQAVDAILAKRTAEDFFKDGAALKRLLKDVATVKTVRNGKLDQRTARQIAVLRERVASLQRLMELVTPDPAGDEKPAQGIVKKMKAELAEQGKIAPDTLDPARFRMHIGVRAASVADKARQNEAGRIFGALTTREGAPLKDLRLAAIRGDILSGKRPPGYLSTDEVKHIASILNKVYRNTINTTFAKAHLRLKDTDPRREAFEKERARLVQGARLGTRDILREYGLTTGTE